MALETFTWPVRINAAGENSLKVRTASFGDGYAQTAGDGLNSEVSQWSVTLVGKEALVREALDFIRNHGGYRSFIWTPPLSDVGLFRCSEYKPTALGAGNYSLSATFIRTYAP